MIVIALHITSITCKDKVHHVDSTIVIQVVLGKINSSIHLLHHSLDDIQLTFKPTFSHVSILILWFRIGTGVINGDGTDHIERRIEDTHRVITEIVANTTIDINWIVFPGRIAEITRIGQLLIESRRVSHRKLAVVPFNENHQALEIVIINMRPNSRGRTMCTHCSILISRSTHLGSHFLHLALALSHLWSHHFLTGSQERQVLSCAGLRITGNYASGHQLSVSPFLSITIESVSALDDGISVDGGRKTQKLVAMQAKCNHSAVRLFHVGRLG